MKVHVGIIRDHSASMRSLATGAANDYNLTIEGIKESGEYSDTRVSVVECGVGVLAHVVPKERNVPVSTLKPLSIYNTTGHATPLWRSVGTLITNMQADACHSRTDAFLVMVITDGRDNVGGSEWNAESVARAIQRLQGSDRWTFVFRVPVGYRNDLVRMGIPSGNIIEWEQTEQSIVASTQQNVQATRSYFKAASLGKTSTTSFYTTDLSNVSPAEIRSALKDITDDIALLKVKPTENGMQIRDFCLDRLGNYVAGNAFYQLTKPEKIQANKKIIIKHKKKGKSYAGEDARSLLGLPLGGEIKVRPGDHSVYDIYVQSNSVNRKLVEGTNIIYWNRN